MGIDQQLIDYMEADGEEAKKIREAELKKDIEVASDYELMKKTTGWKRLERAILDRTSFLSGRLLTVNDEKNLFRIQGELLGIQSILNIIDTALLISEEAKNILKGDENNG